ncbi:hypothetical protein BRADI_3g57955v3 [Brachypodium distachyon]|uniref:Uncharacterized protein n=1 Tax=Brachypodium distachyon TaxID=15368 RepID=A0A0Q3I7J7_BRADI|nr:hypothetical protein BRADI_3g57955v3 [Brachypodium distachyon]
MIISGNGCIAAVGRHLYLLMPCELQLLQKRQVAGTLQVVNRLQAGRFKTTDGMGPARYDFSGAMVFLKPRSYEAK